MKQKLKGFFGQKKVWIPLVTVCVLLLLAAGSFGGYEYWLYQQVKFQDVTIELGTESISISQFLTEYARAEKVSVVTDLSEIDIGKVGQYSLTFRHGRQEQTVTLTVQDTTAPTADFATEVTMQVDQTLQAEDLVENIQDYSETQVYFEESPVIPEDYADQSVTVVVEDACGNKIQQTCLVSYQWMIPSCTLELGEALTAQMLLLDPEKDAALLDQAVLDAFSASPVGVYEVTTDTGAKSDTCTVTIQDTRAPELVLQQVSCYIGDTAELEDFVVSATDASGDVTLRLLTELAFDTSGSFTVVVEAEDVNGNVTQAETSLIIAADIVAPTISGLTSMTVSKGSSAPDYLSGVTATDDVDGTVSVSYDAGSVNLNQAGTYYITYTAKDSAGNITTAKRKITVVHDGNDTDALVASIASKLSDDPEEIRDYVRSTISYSHDWGGDDPVYYGFTNKVGNCYVHAMCLKAIFDLKGIESQLIWVTDKSHYWLIVKIDGEWKHIDATPGPTHSVYSLMNDEQRLETLSGRVWDFDAWPACT